MVDLHKMLPKFGGEAAFGVDVSKLIFCIAIAYADGGVVHKAFEDPIQVDSVSAK